MKKSKLLSLLVITASTVLLASCTTAQTSLKNGNDQLTDTTVTGVDNDTLKALFNTIYSGSSFSSDIKEMLNREVSISNLGEFYFGYDATSVAEDPYYVDIKWSEGETTYYWKNATNEQKNSFLANHKVYWNWVDTGINIQYESSFDSTKLSQYEARIDNLTSLVKTQVIKSIYTSANSSSYTKHNRFYETLFARNIANQLYVIQNKDGSTISNEKATFDGQVSLYSLYLDPDYSLNIEKDSEKTTLDTTGTVKTINEFSYKMLIDGTYDPYTTEGSKNIYLGENKLLHLYHYVDYINATILPTIQNALLTEQYIFDNAYTAVGRTQQRKVSYIEITDSNYKKARNLLTNFANDYIKTFTPDNTHTSVDFSIAQNAWKGIPATIDSDTTTKALTIKTFGDASTTNPNTQIKSGKYIDGKTDYKYYPQTSYFDIIKDYSKLTNNPTTNDSSLYTGFTEIDSRYYEPSEGLQIKTDNLKAQSTIVSKWGAKADFNGLPSDITDKLFNYGIIKEVNDYKADSSKAIDKQYLKSFVPNGPAFLKRDNYASTSDVDSIIWESSGKYYIVIVEDSISSSSLSYSDTNNDLVAIEKTAREAGYVLASGSTYTKDALEYYIKDSEVVYFDQKVYDYFVSEFPDLF